MKKMKMIRAKREDIFMLPNLLTEEICERYNMLVIEAFVLRTYIGEASKGAEKICMER